MKEYELNSFSSREEITDNSNLPAKIGFLNRLKHFWAYYYFAFFCYFNKEKNTIKKGLIYSKNF